MMDLGWKTILGGVLIAFGQLAGAAVNDCPVPSWIPWLKWFSSLGTAGGMIFGAVGISSKVAKVANLGVQAIGDMQERLQRSFEKQRVIVQERVVEKKIPYVIRRLNNGDVVRVKKPNGSTEDIKVE